MLRGAAGYSLIELVVALALLALASLLIAEALRFGLHAWERVNAGLSRAEAVATAQQALRGLLQSVDPYRVPGLTEAAPAYPLVGQSAEVSFSAPGPHALAGQMLRYRIFLSRGGAPGRLSAAWQSEERDAGMTDTAAGEEVLLDGVAELEFEYFGRGANGSGEWNPMWQDKAEPPALVRLRLRFADGHAGDWPVLVVRSHLSMPADCQFDLVSRRCR